MNSSQSEKPMSEENGSPKVWTELTSAPKDLNDVSNDVLNDDSMTEWDSTQDMTQPLGAEPSEPPVLHLHCLESGDGTDYSVMAVVNAERTQRPYCPSHESRQLHNHKERLRRSRMKCSCDALRALVPGLNDKTDKATVLEHTVNFLFHLSKCSGVKCDDYLPITPPPMSAKLLELYPTLMTGEYRYYEAMPNPNPELDPNDSHIIEVHESNGTQYVTTSDGYQYMIVDSSGDQPQEMTAIEGTDASNMQFVDSNDGNQCPTEQQMAVDIIKGKVNGQSFDECNRCVERVINLLDDNKENIDPNCVKPEPKRRGRKPKHRLLSEMFDDNSNRAPVVDVPSTVSTGVKKRKYKKRKPKAI